MPLPPQRDCYLGPDLPGDVSTRLHIGRYWPDSLSILLRGAVCQHLGNSPTARQAGDKPTAKRMERHPDSPSKLAGRFGRPHRTREDRRAMPRAVHPPDVVICGHFATSSSTVSSVPHAWSMLNNIRLVVSGAPQGSSLFVDSLSRPQIDVSSMRPVLG